jgi:dihydroorotate dehydrogenase
MSALHAAAARALRLLDPEYAHRLTIAALRAGLGPRAREAAEPILATSLAGLPLVNPIGLAPGFDKNGEVAAAMLAAGFGYVECGTATPLAQRGNPRPRVFRLVKDAAVINRLGFNNHGLEAFAARLAAGSRGGIVGANIGANKQSPNPISDYVSGLRRLWGVCDYFTLNISSPNTPGLRALQGAGALEDLLGEVRAARALLASGGDHPIFLKVAPDIAEARIEGIVDAALEFGLQGLVVSNTTLARPEGLRSAGKDEAGGLSGAPLMDLSTRLLRSFSHIAAGRLTLIGVGGIGSGADAYAKIRAGASAVQLYTALIFRGPDLVLSIRRELAALLRADGFAGVGEAVGAL